MDLEFPNPVRNEEGDNAAANQLRREPMPEQRGGDLQGQLHVDFREVEEERAGGELVRDNVELPGGASQSIVPPKEPDGDVEFVMIGSNIVWRGEVTNNGTQLRRKSLAQLSEWPKLKTILEEK